MATDFFKKHPWGVGQIDWHFLVIFDKQPQIKELAEAYKPLLQHPGLYPPIPAQWLHATLLRVGSIEIISEESMEEVAQLIQKRSRDLTVPELTLDSPWVWSGSVCLSVNPGEPMKNLFKIIEAATTEVLKDKAPTPEKFVPHVTLAYPRDTNDDEGIEKQLKQAQVDPMKFVPTELCLVKQRQTPPYYQWEVITRIPLSS